MTTKQKSFGDGYVRIVMLDLVSWETPRKDYKMLLCILKLLNLWLFKIMDFLRFDNMNNENKIITGDNVKVMSSFDDASVHFGCMSPPYDSLRNYNGFSIDLHGVGQQMYRILKNGGICAVVIQDETKNFGKSLTSFKLVVDWCDSIGFKLFETIIYKKQGVEGAWWKKRFRVDHEYIFLFLKGDRPLYFNKE